jgi:uncharacterized membrane protein
MKRWQLFWGPLYGLTLAAMLPAGLVFFRMMRTHRLMYGFLLWNLFLAWLPLVFAWLSLKAASRRPFLALLSALAWLVFLPNAPYLITDLVHLRPFGDIAYFYDVTMLFILTLTGLAYGFVSLRWMQEVVALRWGRGLSYLFAVLVLALSSFGIYLGRFLRWNSWDILVHPYALFGEIAVLVHHPVRHASTWAHVALFSVALVFSYALMVYLISGALRYGNVSVNGPSARG